MRTEDSGDMYTRKAKDSQPKASEAGRLPLYASRELGHADTLIATSSLQNCETTHFCVKLVVRG